MDRTLDIGGVIRRRRAELGLSQTELAAAAGVDPRQIRRYETGEQQPILGVAVAIADALQISVGDLAGIPRHRIDLTGDWHFGWQSTRDSAPVIAVQEVRIKQQGELLTLETLARGRPVEDGGYHWNGELRLWDNEILIGWYASTDPTVRSKGSLYFTLHTQGLNALGRWVGLSYDSDLSTGLGAMSRTDNPADIITTALNETEPRVSGAAAETGNP